jgi:hypothetical protein
MDTMAGITLLLVRSTGLQNKRNGRKSLVLERDGMGKEHMC